jgi:hypothetical protein
MPDDLAKTDPPPLSHAPHAANPAALLRKSTGLVATITRTAPVRPDYTVAFSAQHLDDVPAGGSSPDGRDDAVALQLDRRLEGRPVLRLPNLGLKRRARRVQARHCGALLLAGIDASICQRAILIG